MRPYQSMTSMTSDESNEKYTEHCDLKQDQKRTYQQFWTRGCGADASI